MLYANSNFCALRWYFCSAKSAREIEKIQTRVLRFLCNDFDSDYKTLLDKSDKCAMEVKRLRTLGIEIFKTLNQLNPAFIEEIYHRTKWLIHRLNNIQVNVHETVKYGGKILRTLSVLIFGIHSQSRNNCIKFKEYINQLFGQICKCNFCVYDNKQVSELHDYNLGFNPFTENSFTFFVLSFSV